KLTPWVFITQSITEPPAPQPKQLNRLDDGLIMQDGVLSLWKGQHTATSFPCFTSAYPWLSANRTSDTSALMRSITSSANRAIRPPFGKHLSSTLSCRF